MVLCMFTETLSRYVTRNSEILSGEPIIIGTRTSVRAIVGLWRLGVMPEEILNHLPHLTLAQVFDALSFYLDHQAEINEYIERNQVPDELVHPFVSKRKPAINVEMENPVRADNHEVDFPPVNFEVEKKSPVPDELVHPSVRAALGAS